MSTGSVKDRKIESKEDVIEKASVELARQWCDDCRAALGKAPIDRTKMALATSGVDSRLEDLASLAILSDTLPETVKGYEKQFKEIAYQLHHLNATVNELIASKKTAGKDQKKNISANIKKQRELILAQVAKLNTLEEQLKREVEQEEQRQKSVTSTIKSSKDGAQILTDRKDFSKQLVILQRIFEYFQKNFDQEKSNEIRAKVEHYKGINWLKVGTKSESEQHKVAITNDVQAYKNTQQQYVTHKKNYKQVLPQAQLLTQQAVSLLPPTELTTVLSTFSTAETAAFKRCWPGTADVNTVFNTNLEKRVNQAKLAFEKWEVDRKNGYDALKTELDKITISEYQMVGYSIVAKAIDKGDDKRNFTEASQELATAKEKVAGITKSVAAYKQCLVDLNDLISQARAVKVTGAGAPLAPKVLDALAPIATGFTADVVSKPFAENRVPSEVDVKEAFKKCSAKVAELKQQLLDLNDQNKAKQLIEELKKAGNIEPLLNELEGELTKATIATENYASTNLGTTVTAPTGSGTWKTKLDEASQWLTARRESVKAKESIVFDTVSSEQVVHKNACTLVFNEATQAILDAKTEITKAQQELITLLNTLDSRLSGARLKTFRKATWLASAQLEAKELRSSAQAENLQIIAKKKLRVQDLINQAMQVIDSTPLDRIYDDGILKVYSGFKGRLEGPIKRFNSKEVRGILPRQTERFAGKSGTLVQTLAELQNDGPGAMAAKKTQWETTIGKLESEFQPLLNLVNGLKLAREKCLTKVGVVRGHISEELCVAIKVATKTTVLGSSLEFHSNLQEIQGGIVTAETVERYKQLEKQLDNLDRQIMWAIEDIQADSKNAASYVAQFEQASQANEKKHGEEAKLKARYNLAEQAFKKARETVASTKGYDEGEFKRYVDFYKQARKAFKQGSWGEAAKKMDLCCRLMETLAKDPLGSQTTARGQEHLKELNVRWSKAVLDATQSLGNLQKLVETDFEAVVRGKFEAKVTSVVTGKLKADAFRSDLLVLQGPEPKAKEEKEKDLALKRKHREKALATMRSYKALVQNHPIFRSVLFATNPWSKEGGNVNGLGLMRSINDIDLNVSRAVE